MVRFVDDDGFYEGAYLNRLTTMPDGGLLSQLRFYLVNTHYLWWARRWIPRGGRLLELGCGGGVKFFARHARVTGVDLSRGSLSLLDPEYEHALQADALRLPLRDAAYDGVVSSYFFEHIPLDQKDTLLAELRRVLRPGGRIVFLFDVESHNPIFRALRADAARYRAAIIENDRHYGLEPASSNLARFERAGFRVLAHHAANKTLAQHSSVYAWMREYESPVIRSMVRFGAVVSKQPTVGKAYTALVTLLDDAVEPLFPVDWSRILLVALERV
ncbi:MAG: methyltransferase domain-containing protein [Myxococcales bacterium]|nr:methyltransferase domain-containing protein [Myxococcales bacterium]